MNSKLNRFAAFGLLVLSLFGVTGCQSVGVSGIETIIGPVIAGSAEVALKNNPGYIPGVQAVATALETANLTDLSTLGITAAVNAIAAKENLDPSIAAFVTDGIEAGVGIYLGSIQATALTNNPQTVQVVEFIATEILAGANLAAAQPVSLKPKLAPLVWHTVYPAAQ